MSVAKGIAEIAKLITPAIEKALGRGATKQSKAALTRAANKANMPVTEFKKAAKKIIKDKDKPKPKTAKPKTSEPKRTPAENKELRRLIREQEADAAGMARTKGQKELMTKEQYLESNPLEKKAGVGSGADVSGQIMRGQAATREQIEAQIKDLEAADKAGAIGFQITGKRAGGKVRGTGAATRGFGKAGYSYKNI
jgi:hypothetical protein|tara:strand:- start:152 stop:739 length:588 start_codon:yes stop_codon:yes gene_type:complete